METKIKVKKTTSYCKVCNRETEGVIYYKTLRRTDIQKTYFRCKAPKGKRGNACNAITRVN
jgi:hypothetical protein